MLCAHFTSIKIHFVRVATQVQFKRCKWKNTIVLALSANREFKRAISAILTIWNVKIILLAIGTRFSFYDLGLFHLVDQLQHTELRSKWYNIVLINILDLLLKVWVFQSKKLRKKFPVSLMKRSSQHVLCYNPRSWYIYWYNIFPFSTEHYKKDWCETQLTCHLK